MAYTQASGDGEYSVPSPNSGHDELVTPDERAPNSFVVVSVFGPPAVIPAERQRVPESITPVPTN
jgi:hypothetical protein